MTTTASLTPAPGIEKPAAPVAPEVPDKFRNADGSTNTDALLRSYLELEKTRSGAPTTDSSQSSDSAATDANKPGTPDPNAPVTGLEAFQAEYAKDGKLSDESYAKLTKLTGLTKDGINKFIAFQESESAASEKFNNELLTVVGGRETFDEMATWASKNLKADEVTALNKALANSSDPASARLALEGLKAKYVQANGREPKVTIGGRATNTSVQPFQTLAEAKAMLRNPAFKTDQSFRKLYESRMAVSEGIFGEGVSL